MSLTEDQYASIMKRADNGCRREAMPLPPATKAPKESKYKNVSTEVDGFKFDSKAEANRYGELKLLQIAGKIRDLECRKKELKLPLVVNGHSIGYYEADFKYTDTTTGATVWEDYKGMRTPVYIMKRKLVLALHGITIKEV